MLYIEDKHLKIIKDILSKYNYYFYAFGSRVKGNAKKFSDLDLYYEEDISFKIIDKIEEEFEESDLPYKVDIINYNKCEESFQKVMMKNYVCIQEKKLN